MAGLEDSDPALTSLQAPEATGRIQIQLRVLHMVSAQGRGLRPGSGNPALLRTHGLGRLEAPAWLLLAWAETGSRAGLTSRTVPGTEEDLSISRWNRDGTKNVCTDERTRTARLVWCDSG